MISYHRMRESKKHLLIEGNRMARVNLNTQE